MKGKEFTSKFVTSKDGTKIHYRQLGSGEGLVLVHGALLYSENFMPLATLLADDFTVYIPDRCGRGLSEMHKNYSLLAEGEDIQAILNQTKAENIFGLSAGAIIVLQTALSGSGLKKIALYEPPVLTDSSQHSLNKMAENYRLAMRKRNYGKAFISILKGTGDNGLLMKYLPRLITAPLMNLAIKSEAKKKPDIGKEPLKSLISALQYDLEVVNQSWGMIEKCKDITADILLLGGRKSITYLKDILGTLSSQLPDAKSKVFPNAGHMAACDKPDLVAREMKEFFLRPL